MSKPLTAYCMKTKEKNVPLQEAVITMLGEATALEAIKNGVAKQGF